MSTTRRVVFAFILVRISSHDGITIIGGGAALGKFQRDILSHSQNRTQFPVRATDTERRQAARLGDQNDETKVRRGETA